MVCCRALPTFPFLNAACIRTAEVVHDAGTCAATSFLFVYRTKRIGSAQITVIEATLHSKCNLKVRARVTEWLVTGNSSTKHEFQYAKVAKMRLGLLTCVWAIHATVCGECKHPHLEVSIQSFFLGEAERKGTGLPT